MDNRETQCSAPAVVLALLGGVVAGVVAGLLLAPKSGEEARRALKGYARKTEEEVLERAKEVRAALDETIDRGTRFVAEKTADVEAAVKAGRETMKEKTDKCCNGRCHGQRGLVRSRIRCSYVSNVKDGKGRFRHLFEPTVQTDGISHS